VPWYLIPLNIFLNIYLILSIVFSPEIKRLNKIRKQHGMGSKFPFLEPYSPKRHYLIPSALECDFPFSYIPANVTACGPILLPSPSLSSVDPELETWLKQNPTVMINLGSNYTVDADFSGQLAYSIRLLLNDYPRLQVLWKLKTRGPVGDAIFEILSEELSSERVKIVSWVRAEPGALVRSGLIICSVHHGGANSYYEAVE
jgi:hypothetical protein